MIPVVQEELEIGKRSVQAGGIRVQSQVVETPVSESVELREERAHVERRPVERPVSYEEVEPAYRFGHTLAGNTRYQGRAWEDIEADARNEWGRSQDGSTWEHMKDAVRHAWQRAKS